LLPLLNALLLLLKHTLLLCPLVLNALLILNPLLIEHTLLILSTPLVEHASLIRGPLLIQHHPTLLRRLLLAAHTVGGKLPLLRSLLPALLLLIHPLLLRPLVLNPLLIEHALLILSTPLVEHASLIRRPLLRQHHPTLLLSLPLHRRAPLRVLLPSLPPLHRHTLPLGDPLLAQALLPHARPRYALLSQALLA